MDDLEIHDERIDSEVGGPLVGAQWRELMTRYGVAEADAGFDALDPEHFTPPHGAFVVAWIDGAPVGCGGVRPFDDVSGEIKRMYVVPSARRRGIAVRVLQTVEDRARGLGYARLVLETGIAQPEAISLYEREGYTGVPGFGPHADLDVLRWYAKLL